MARIFFFNVVGLLGGCGMPRILYENETFTIEEFASAGNAKGHKSAEKLAAGVSWPHTSNIGDSKWPQKNLLKRKSKSA